VFFWVRGTVDVLAISEGFEANEDEYHVRLVIETNRNSQKKMGKIIVNDPFREVLVRWREHRKNISKKVKKSRIEWEKRHRVWQRVRLSIFCSLFLALGIAMLMLVPDFRKIFGASAELVLLIVFAWAFLCMVFVGLQTLPSVWTGFFRGMDELFAAASNWYERDKTFVDTLADDAALDLGVIARRLKGEIEFREKLSAFLAIIAGGASFSSLGTIWDSLVKRHPNPWLIVPTSGLAMTAILLQTLFIAARIKGDLLVCLEEAQELRKRRQNIPVVRENKTQFHSEPAVTMAPFVQRLDQISESHNGSLRVKRGNKSYRRLAANRRPPLFSRALEGISCLDGNNRGNRKARAGSTRKR
jgi:hypothetical protein